MAERVNRLYRPDDLLAAIEALTGTDDKRRFTFEDASNIVKELHRRGFKIVKITEPEE